MEPITENLDDILEKLVMDVAEVKAVAIVSAEGLPIASFFSQEVDETKLAAIIASFFSLAESSVTELKRGEIDQIIIKESKGYLIILQAGPNAIMIISLTDIKGIFFDNKRTCERIAKLL